MAAPCPRRRRAADRAARRVSGRAGRLRLPHRPDRRRGAPARRRLGGPARRVRRPGRGPAAVPTTPCSTRWWVLAPGQDLGGRPPGGCRGLTCARCSPPGRPSLPGRRAPARKTQKATPRPPVARGHLRDSGGDGIRRREAAARARSGARCRRTDRAVTLRDVAARAGVDPATASRALKPEPGCWSGGHRAPVPRGRPSSATAPTRWPGACGPGAPTPSGCSSPT